MSKSKGKRQPEGSAGDEEQKPDDVIEPKPGYEPIRLTTHKDLIAQQQEIFRRLGENPETATMLLINPVLAMKEVGVEMTREIAHHVLHTIQHTPRLRRRREELEAKLKEDTGEAPRPDDPEWVSHFLFEVLQLQPLQTKGYEPTYRSPLNEAAVERLKALRPQRPRQRGKERPGDVAETGAILRVRIQRPSLRRLAVDAEVPELEPAEEAPNEVDLETLFFYKESHPLARDLLELGTIQRRSFPIHSGDSYRRIRSGDKPNAFRSWIKNVRFPEEGGDESDG